MRTPEFRKANSRNLFSSVANSNSTTEKVSVEGRNVTSVPLFPFAGPISAKGATDSPFSNRIE